MHIDWNKCVIIYVTVGGTLRRTFLNMQQTYLDNMDNILNVSFEWVTGKRVYVRKLKFYRNEENLLMPLINDVVST